MFNILCIKLSMVLFCLILNHFVACVALCAILAISTTKRILRAYLRAYFDEFHYFTPSSVWLRLLFAVPVSANIRCFAGGGIFLPRLIITPCWFTMMRDSGFIGGNAISNPFCLCVLYPRSLSLMTLICGAHLASCSARCMAVSVSGSIQLVRIVSTPLRLGIDYELQSQWREMLPYTLVIGHVS